MCSLLSRSLGITTFHKRGETPVKISIDLFKNAEGYTQAIQFNTSELSKPMTIRFPTFMWSYSFGFQWLSLMNDILTENYIYDGKDFGLSVYLTISLLDINDSLCYT